MSELNKGNIVDLIWWDIKFALEQLNEQLENKEYRFLFIHSNRKLFDITSFRYYLETTEIKNTTRIDDIYDNCLKIVELHNIDIPKIQHSPLPKGPTLDIELDNGGYVQLSVPYVCLKIIDKEVTYVNSNGYNIFFNNYQYKRFESISFARNAAQIVNDISAFIPKFLKQALYIDIVAKLYNNLLKANNETHFDPLQFIEERHLAADLKGIEFYEKILQEFDKHKASKTSIKQGRFLYDDCLQYINYCEGQISNLKKNAFQMLDTQNIDVTLEVNNNVYDPDGTIQELTEDNLRKLGFDEETITHFFDPNYPNVEHRYNDIVLASKSDRKIYSGFMGARKFYFRGNNIQFPYKFPRLIDEYYQNKLAQHLLKKETLLGVNYHRISETEIFINKQVKWVNEEIEAHQAQIKTYKFSWQNAILLSLRDQIEILESYLAFLNRSLVLTSSSNRNTSHLNSQADDTIRPIFKREIVSDLYLLLRDFFAVKQQPVLKELLSKGDNKNKDILLFKDNGNRLTDAFRQLKEIDLITGCHKKDLEKWIMTNFRYLNRNKFQIFTADYVEKCISRNSQPCKKPLFSIVSGKLIKK